MPPVIGDTVDRKVTEKVGSVIPIIGSGPKRTNSNSSGPLTLTPTSANSSWYSGVAAVTAQIMPRAFWQSSAGDLQESILSVAERNQVESSSKLSRVQLDDELQKQLRSDGLEEWRKREGKHRARQTSTSSSSSSSSSEDRKKKRKRKRKASTSSSSSTSSTSSSEEQVRKKKKAPKNADQLKAKSDDRYYSKYPRQSQSADSPDTTVQRNEMSQSVSSGSKDISGLAQASSRSIGTVKKCAFCVNTLVLADDMEAHINRIHNNARFGCCLCNSMPEEIVINESDDESFGATNSKQFFDTYSEAKSHVASKHNITAEEILDQFVVMPPVSFLRQFSCLMCNQSLIGLSDENLRAHFKKVHSAPFLPQLVRSSCRVCGFSEAKTDADLVKHVETAHPRSSLLSNTNAESEPAPAPVPVSKHNEFEPRIVKKDIVENILRSHKDSAKNEETESLVSSKAASRKKKKKKDVTSDSSEESSESDSSEDSKKKRKRKKKSKKKKKKTKKKKVEESSDTSDDEEDEDDADVEVKSVDSNKHAIEFFNSKRQRSRDSEKNDDRISHDRESGKENKQKDLFIPYKVQPPGPRASVEVVEVETRTVRRESEGERSSRKSDHNRSLSKDRDNRSPARRSRSHRSADSDIDKHRRNCDSDDGKRHYRNHHDDCSDYDDRRGREYDDRRHSQSRRDYSDDDDEKRRVHIRRDDSDDRDSHRRSRWESGDLRDGFCDDCNCSIPAGKISEHFNSKLHHAKTRGKIRCFLCNKSMANARQHLEMNHQNDIFRCNVKNCMCPKFVDAKKILDHLERTHTSITQGKTTEQLVRGGFLTLPKNLEVHNCAYCNIGLAGQHIDRIFTHMMDRCGVRNPKESDVIFSCRLCGPRREFDNQEQLRKHCSIHLDSVKEAKYANNSVVKRPDSPVRRRDSHDSRSYTPSPDRNRRSSRRRSSSSESSDRSVSPPRPPKFNCFFCTTTFESETNREHHMLEKHKNALFTCKLCSSDSPFRAANRFDVYDHLTSVHNMDDDEEELFSMLIRPHDLRKIICLKCGEKESLKNAQWLCKDGHEVSADLKDHLLSCHKGTRVVSSSFGLRCGACSEEYEYDKEEEWTAHVRNFHSRSPVRNSPVRPPVKYCIYCPKPETSGHVTSEHLNMTFRCKTCTDVKMFADFSEIRRHYAIEHAIRDVSIKTSEYVAVPPNLVCLKCKFCRRHLHAQTIQDFEEHFKVEHPAVKSPKKHLDLLCRICMQSDINETIEDLEQHIEEEHSDILKAAALARDVNVAKESGDDSVALNRAAADKAKSPDSTSSLKIRYTPASRGRLSICPFCNKTISALNTSSTSSFDALQSHLENSHGPETGFVCKLCSNPNSMQHVFMDAAAASDHLKEFHRNVDCNDLKRAFTLPADNRSFRCQKCSQMFLAQDFHSGGILSHLRVAHGCDPNCSRSPMASGEDRRLTALNIVVIRCRKCEGVFRDETLLIEHSKFCSAG